MKLYHLIVWGLASAGYVYAEISGLGPFQREAWQIALPYGLFAIAPYVWSGEV
jgi:hypothetical protein